MSNSPFTISEASGGGSGGTVTAIEAGDGLSGGIITTSGTISITPTGVTAGDYTAANITVNDLGQITTAANGSVGTVTSLTAGVGLVATPDPITATGSYALDVPVNVQHGGTGLTTQTPYGVCVGGTAATDPMQSVTPGASGTFLQSAGSSALPIWAAATGKLIQIQQTTLTTQSTVLSAGAFVDIGLSVNITPTKSTSTILILGLVNLSGASGVASPNFLSGFYKLLRNGLDTLRGNALGTAQRALGSFFLQQNAGTGFYFSSVPVMYMDAPASTSLLTYKIQGYIPSGSLTVNQAVNTGSTQPTSGVGASVLLAIEIGA